MCVIHVVYLLQLKFKTYIFSFTFCVFHRVLFGPEMVMLGPDEQFTMLSLSGDKPKRPNVIKTICLLLGPDFCTDIITIETADHARLQLQLSYNWYVVVCVCSKALFEMSRGVQFKCK